MTSSLAALEARIAKDLEIVAYPDAAWVPEHRGPDERPILDVLVIGGGQGGLAVGHALKRARVDRVRIVDRSDEGREGPWLTYARMQTLRSPKEINGPDLDVPSLAFRSWYVAQHGEGAWEGLNKIPKEDWAAYLLWLRRVLEIRIENGVEAARIAPCDPASADGPIAVDLHHLAEGRVETVLARKVVVATGIEASGRWWTPPVVEALDKRFWAHSSEMIDFAALKGRRVAVLGAGASALDNAATALEQGAGEVTVFCRRAELQRFQPFRFMSFPGFLGHFRDLDDAWRWRIANHLLTLREAFPRETWERASRHAGFALRTDAGWDRLTPTGDSVAIDSAAGRFEVDFLIAGTGFDMDLGLRPEMAAIAPVAALWRDRYAPPEAEANERLARYPYLDDSFAFVERQPGTAPWLRHVRLFTYGTTVSFGPSGSSINAMKFAVPRLVSGIVRDLFAEDIEIHWQGLKAYNLPEFLFDGEAGEAAPLRAVIDR